MQNMIEVVKNVSRRKKTGYKKGPAVGQKGGGEIHIVEQERDRTSSNILCSTQANKY